MMSSNFYDVIFDLDNDAISKVRLANVTYFLSMRQLLPFSPILFGPDCISTWSTSKLIQYIVILNINISISIIKSLCSLCWFYISRVDKIVPLYHQLQDTGSRGVFMPTQTQKNNKVLTIYSLVLCHLIMAHAQTNFG